MQVERLLFFFLEPENQLIKTAFPKLFFKNKLLSQAAINKKKSHTQTEAFPNTTCTFKQKPY